MKDMESYFWFGEVLDNFLFEGLNTKSWRGISAKNMNTSYYTQLILNHGWINMDLTYVQVFLECAPSCPA